MDADIAIFTTTAVTEGRKGRKVTNLVRNSPCADLNQQEMESKS